MASRLDTEVLPVLPPGCHERPGRHRRSNRGKPLEGAGNSDAEDPRTSLAGSPHLCSLAQGSHQAPERAASLETPRDPNAKPALQPKDQEVGRTEISSVCMGTAPLAKQHRRGVAPAPSLASRRWRTTPELKTRRPAHLCGRGGAG